MSASLVQMLREHKAASAYSQPGDPVFANREGKPLDHRNVAARGLDKAVKEAKLDDAGKPKLRWHGLRHTAASLLIGQGLDPVFVSKMLGHAKRSITLDTYGHLWDARAHSEAVDLALGGNCLETSGGNGGGSGGLRATGDLVELPRVGSGVHG